MRSQWCLGPSPVTLYVLSVLSVASVLVVGLVPWERAPQRAFPHYPRSLCAHRATQVVLAIRSAPDRQGQRDNIRRTIGSAAVRAALPGWQLLFYMGFVNDTASMDSVRGEISRHSDVLVSAFETAAGTSAVIALDAVWWVLERCGKETPLRLFVHTNDTVLVDPVALEEYSRKMNGTKHPTFHCPPAPGDSVKDNAASVTSVLPRYVFWRPTFPPGCEGDAFFVEGSHLAWLYTTSLRWLHYALLLQHLNLGMPTPAAHMGFFNISRRIGVGGSLNIGPQSSISAVSSEKKLFVVGGPNNTWEELWLDTLIDGTNKPTSVEPSPPISIDRGNHSAV